MPSMIWFSMTDLLLVIIIQTEAYGRVIGQKSSICKHQGERRVSDGVEKIPVPALIFSQLADNCINDGGRWRLRNVMFSS